MFDFTWSTVFTVSLRSCRCGTLLSSQIATMYLLQDISSLWNAPGYSNFRELFAGFSETKQNTCFLHLWWHMMACTFPDPAGSYGSFVAGTLKFLQGFLMPLSLWVHPTHRRNDSTTLSSCDMSLRMHLHWRIPGLIPPYTIGNNGVAPAGMSGSYFS